MVALYDGATAGNASTFGTFVNGARVRGEEGHRLMEGDTLTLGVAEGVAPPNVFKVGFHISNVGFHLSDTLMQRVGQDRCGGARRPMSGSFGGIRSSKSIAMNIGVVPEPTTEVAEGIEGKKDGRAALFDGSRVITLHIIDRRTPQVRPAYGCTAVAVVHAFDSFP